ncbi:enoyl-CoA hydratase-related protein [Neobacillus niacini]|uniref:enoyl-CoA hydratase/isomerase family protein n=1 Tax=Neobacillus niacini TaxID=86668 RepID=UPI002FFED252
MKNESVIYSVKNGVGHIQLNEPSSLNALTPGIKDGLISSLNMAEEDVDVKVIMIYGLGRAFCAGGDLKGMGNQTAIQAQDKMDKTSQIIHRIAEIKKPIIGAVHGYAVGAGFSLALACDIIFAEEGAKFGLSFSKVGLIPDLGLLYHLPRIVGTWKAKEWIFTGETISAGEAKEYGIINRLVQEGMLIEEASLFAETLSKGPVKTMGFVKGILAKTANQTLSATIEYENYAQSLLMQSDDHKEGVRAFKEKTTPTFTGM